MSNQPETVTFKKDDVIFEANSPANLIYVLQEGELGVKFGNSPEIEVGTIFPGESFGESALIAGARRSATISCVTDSTLLAFDASQWQEFFKNWPEGRLLCQCVLIELINANERIRKQTDLTLNYSDSKLLVDLVSGAIRQIKTLSLTLRSNEDLIEGLKQQQAFIITGGHGFIQYGDKELEVHSDRSLGASEIVIGRAPEKSLSLSQLDNPLVGWFIPILEPFEMLLESNKGIAAIIRGIAHKTIRTRETG
jgi:CRP-like cAMP-binding protein